MAFHVPTAGRIRTGRWASDDSYGNYGAFLVPSPEPGWVLALICAGSELAESDGWEHVSVHAENAKGKKRTPTWTEMVFVKRLCWDPDDLVVQYHPPERDYVNVHPHVLHLWRWAAGQIPMPPKHFV